MAREMETLERKRRIVKRWTIALAIAAFLVFAGLTATVIEKLLKGAPGGGLEINTNKLDQKLAWLGSEIRDINDIISEELGLFSTDGVLVNDVTADSPADKAGLQRGDVILSFDDTDIRDSLHIQEEMLESSPGDTVTLLVDTVDGGKKIVKVELEAKPDDDTTSGGSGLVKVAGDTDQAAPAAPVLSTVWGISVSPLTREIRDQLSVPPSEHGIIIVTVARNSIADNQGLEVGDIIENVNNIATHDLRSFYSAIQDEEGVLLDVYSADDDKRFFVTLPDEGDSPPQVVLMNFDDDQPAKNRVIVASDSDDLDGSVFYRFASSPYFILYDINKNEMTVIKNPYAAQVRGMGIPVAQMLIQQNIDAVIVGGIGPQSFDSLYLAKVKVYGPVTGSVRKAIVDYQSGRIKELKEATLGGYGYSSSATIPTGSSPWTEEIEEEDEEEGKTGYLGQPLTIPPKGKPGDETVLTAGNEPRANRPDVCVCPSCGVEVSHPSSVSCSDMVCPVCGSQLMNASPGTDSSGGPDVSLELPTTVSPITIQKVSSNLWAISSKPADIPPQGGQLTAGTSGQTSTTTTSKVTTCYCPLCGTTVTHPIGIPCAALQCPTCGGRLVSSTSAMVSQMTMVGGIQTAGPMQTAGPVMTGGIQTAGPMQTGGKPDDMPPIQQTFYLIPVAGGPVQTGGIQTAGPMQTAGPVMTGGIQTAGPMQTAGPVMTGGIQTAGPVQQAFYLIPVAGGPSQGGPETGGPSSAGPVVDGPSLGGGQADSGAAQSGRSTECICPMCKTIVTHPIGIPCASLTCPVCGSRLVNAEPGGATGAGAGMQTAGPVMTGGIQTAGSMQTGGIQTAGPMQTAGPVMTGGIQTAGPVQQTFYLIPVAGGPSQGGPETGGPSSAGPVVDGPSLGGGQADSGAAQSGRSTECICPMCKTIVTHPIGIPCASLTCPVCGSRLVNAEPGGATGAGAGMQTAGPVMTGGIQTAGPMQTAGPVQQTFYLIPVTSKPDGVPLLGQSQDSAYAKIAGMIQTGGTTLVAQSKVVQISTASRKVVIPSMGRSLKSDIASMFDRAPYFIMFSLGKYDVVKNPYYRDRREVGTEVAQFVVSEGGAIVICDNIGMTAVQALKDLKVKVYPGFTGTVQQAIDIYSDGRLKDSGTITGIVLDDDKSEHEGGGGGPPTSKDKKKDKGEDDVF